jgi:hypothetical protein
MFTKNRERLLNEQIMKRFLGKLMAAPEVKPLLSDEHFSVDGTLLQAWASHASLEPIDGQDDQPPPPSGIGEGFGAPKDGKKRTKATFAASSSAIKRTAPAVILTIYWPGNPMSIQLSRAIGIMG